MANFSTMEIQKMFVNDQKYLEEAFSELGNPTEAETGARGRCEYFMRILSTLDAEDALIKEQFKARQAEIMTARKALHYYKYDQFVQDMENLDYKGKKSITFLHGKAGTRKKGDALAVTDENALIDWVQDNIELDSQAEYLKTTIKIKKTPFNEQLKSGAYALYGIPSGTEFVPAHEEFYPKNINKTQELF